MKKVVVMTIFMVSIAAMAQKGGQHHKGKDMYAADMTAEQAAILETKKMALELDLTEAQQKEIQEVNLEKATYKKAKMEARKAKKEEIEKTKPTSDERFAMKKERLDRQLAHKQKMKQLLTEEQFNKWEKMQSHRGRHHRGHGKKERGESKP